MVTNRDVCPHEDLVVCTYVCAQDTVVFPCVSTWVAFRVFMCVCMREPVRLHVFLHSPFPFRSTGAALFGYRYGMWWWVMDTMLPNHVELLGQCSALEDVAYCMYSFAPVVI